MYPEDEVRAIGEWAVEHELWVVTDEIYEHLTYGDHRFTSMPTVVPELAERCVVLNGVAKTYAMTGWRVGWMIGPADVIKAATNLQSHATSNVANVSQRAALAAVAGDLDAVAEMRAAYDRRGATIHKLLNEIPGVDCMEPQGAFYAFPSFVDVLGQRDRRPAAAEHPRAGRGHPRQGQGRHRSRRGVRRARVRAAVVRAGRRRTGRGHRPHRRSAGGPGLSERMPNLPHGSWPSPITADLLVQQAVSLGDVTTGTSDLWWSELRPHEGAGWRSCVCAPAVSGARCSPPTSRPAPACTSTAAAPGGCTTTVVFVANWTDQRLYRIDTDSAPKVLTPEPAVPLGARYADGRVTVDGRWVVCVRELHDANGGEPANEIVAIEAHDGGEPLVLVSGPDFVSSPRPSPDALRLCWTQWNHPNMPWDSAELWVADLVDDADGIRIDNARRVAGGDDESVFQPSWSATGDLLFVSDRTNWWNLYRIGAGLDPAAEPEAVAPIEAEIGVPQWVFDQSRYAELSDGRILCAFGARRRRPPRCDRARPARSAPPRDPVHLVLVAATVRCGRGADRRVADERAGRRDRGSARGHRSRRRSRWCARRATSVSTRRWLSVPQPITFPTTPATEHAHALFYPPTNPEASPPPTASSRR